MYESEEDSLSSSPHRRVGQQSSRRRNSTEIILSTDRYRDTSCDASSSSSVANDDDNETSKKPRVKRRKRRKRLNTDSSSLAQDRAALIDKAVQIEIALLSQKPSGIQKLKELSTSEHGLLNDDLRRRTWPKLVNIEVIETDIFPSQEEIEANKWFNQVLLDVNRSLKRFPPGIAEVDRPLLQDKLTRLIIRVLAKHPHLHYYQGFHDIAITFLLAVGDQLGFHIVERLSVGPWLRDFMLPNMERTNYLLHFIYPILRREDPELEDFLERSEVGTIFALPWLITWFGHVLPNYCDVVRLYDFFLAQPPLMPVYLAAAIVLYKRELVLSDECDLATVHALLSKIPVDIPFEKLLVVSRNLYKRHPPDELEPEVERRVKYLEEEANRRRAEVAKKFKLKPKAGKGEGGNTSWTIGRALLLAAPVVIGVLVWKYFNHSGAIYQGLV